MATGASDSGFSHENNVCEEPEDWDYGGVEAIDRVCLEVYTDQRNNMRSSAVVKVWEGGPDPLDYISIYSNGGDMDRGIPPHWHYVSFGFSDLYGDGRVHTFSGSDQSSGFGFELTLRLKKHSGESTPPMWPTHLMNKLANYVFQTGNVFYNGDHIPWHKPLDDSQDSRIQHMLVTKDPQLRDIRSPYGRLSFKQVVGVMDDEMKAAQKWKGVGVLDLMAGTREVGPYFITNTERSKSIFETDANLMHQVTEGIISDGSNLGHVTAVCLWIDINMSLSLTKEESVCDSSDEEPESLEGVHLLFDAEAADLLSMVVRARLQKGKFFVFHNAENHTIHMIPPDCHEDGIYVNQTEPLKAQGTYLQVYCSHGLLEKMATELDCLQHQSQEIQHFPREFHFSDPTILITVSPRGQLMGPSPLL